METDFATFQDENTFDAGSWEHSLLVLGAEPDASAEDDLSLRHGDEPRLGAVYLKRGQPAPSEQRRSCIRVPFIDAHDFSWLNGISRNLMTVPSCTCAACR